MSRELRRFLRSPRGQLTIILGTLAGAVVVALVVALNRSFFEGYVREKYPQPAVEITTLSGAIERGEQGKEAIRRLAPTGRTGLYHVWMRAESTDGLTRLPAACYAADPPHYAALLERTLAAGSPTQRTRAIGFARQSGGAAFVAVLRWGLRRAESTRDPQAEELRQALQAVAGGARAR